MGEVVQQVLGLRHKVGGQGAIIVGAEDGRGRRFVLKRSGQA